MFQCSDFVFKNNFKNQNVLKRQVWRKCVLISQTVPLLCQNGKTMTTKAKFLLCTKICIKTKTSQFEFENFVNGDTKCFNLSFECFSFFPNNWQPKKSKQLEKYWKMQIRIWFVLTQMFSSVRNKVIKFELELLGESLIQFTFKQ